MRTIILTKSQTALVDDADHPYLSQFKWHVTSAGYAATSRTVRGTQKRKSITMHRLLMGAQPGQIIDHINGIRVDNRRSNLRLVSASQNQHNRKRNMHNSSGFKGVTRCRNRWQARIRFQGKQIYLGVYDTPEQAAALYDAAARHFFGDYARTNVPGNNVMKAVEEKLNQILQGDRHKPPRHPSPALPKRRSCYRGIYWHRNRWRSAIYLNGKKIHLGYFVDEIEAARAYDTAARAHIPFNPKLNFPNQ